MNILLTGATGFIGRHLADALSKGDHSLTCLVRANGDTTDLEKLKVRIVYGDLLRKESLHPAMENVDLIYHLAGEVHARHHMDYLRGNVLATQNLLEAGKGKRVKRIVFLSSVGVYKPTSTATLLNEESICEPITIYGKTKLESEEMIKKSHLPWVIVRAPVVYGPLQPPVVNRFFIHAMNKGRMYLIGRGDKLRSLCFIKNLVEGLVLLAEKTDIIGKTYLFSDDPPYTLNQIIETASKVLQKRIHVAHLPNAMGDLSWMVYRAMAKFWGVSLVELYAVKKMQMHEGCDITKARKEIGYAPEVTLEEGIHSTIDWLKNRNRKENDHERKTSGHNRGGGCRR